MLYFASWLLGFGLGALAVHGVAFLKAKEDKRAFTNREVVNLQKEIGTPTQENEMSREFERELISLINRYSKENGSNTPDYILAQYLSACLSVFSATMQKRDSWHNSST
jgi:hypothetical protein